MSNLAFLKGDMQIITVWSRLGQFCMSPMQAHRDMPLLKALIKLFTGIAFTKLVGPDKLQNQRRLKSF